MSSARLVWRDDPREEVEILDVKHLERELRRLDAACGPPIVATIEGAHGLIIGVGLGSPESLLFVHRDRDDGGRDEWVTLGRTNTPDVVDFMVLTDHHTEFERRHLIPIETTLRVALELYSTGRRSDDVAWDHNLT